MSDESIVNYTPESELSPEVLIMEEAKQIPSKKEQIVRLLETKRFNQTEIARQCEVSISYVHKIKTGWQEKREQERFADKIGGLSELCRLYQQTTNVSDLLRLTEMIQQKRAEEREVLKELYEKIHSKVPSYQEFEANFKELKY